MVLDTALSRYAICGIVSCDFTEVRAHDWFSELISRNSVFSRLDRSHMTAAGLGFEPRYSPPKGDVLPLDDPAIIFAGQSLSKHQTITDQ